MAEALPLPASEHAGLLQQLKDSFSEGVQIQKDSDKKTEEKQRLISENTKRAAQIAGRAFESTKGLLKGIDSIAETTILGYSLAKKSFTLAQRSAKAALRGAGKLAGEGLAAGGKKIAGVAKSIMDLLLDGAIMVGIFALLKLFEDGALDWLTLAKDALVGIYDWFVLLFKDPKAAMVQLWNGITGGLSDLGKWIYDNALLPIWNWFSGLFPGTADTMAKLFGGLVTLTGNIGNWIYDNAIKPVWDWFLLLFDNPTEAINKLFTAATKLGEWVYNNAIKPLWDWFNTLFTDPMTAVEQYFKFVGNIGKFVYDEAIAPLWKWFGDTFPGAKEALLEFWNKIFVESSIGSYLYNQMLKPLWDWFSTLFTDPRKALNELWTFFKSFDTWFYNTVLEPLWTWFSGKFPNIAEPLSKLFAVFTSLASWFYDNVISPPWEFIKGIFSFSKDDTGVKEDEFSIAGMISNLASTVWGYVKSLFGFGEEAAEDAIPEVDETELDKIGSKFSLTGLIGDMVDSIVDFFKRIFTFDVKKVFKDVFGALGDFGSKAFNFLFGDDEEDENLRVDNATDAMAKLAEGFQTASITAENIQLSDTALISLAKSLTTGEGGVGGTVINNFFDNSTVTQTNSSGSTNLAMTKDAKNSKALKDG